MGGGDAIVWNRGSTMWNDAHLCVVDGTHPPLLGELHGRPRHPQVLRSSARHLRGQKGVMRGGIKVGSSRREKERHGGQTDRQTDGGILKTPRKTDKRMDRKKKTDGQADRQTDGKT